MLRSARPRADSLVSVNVKKEVEKRASFWLIFESTKYIVRLIFGSSKA